jgi:hypothetical protein
LIEGGFVKKAFMVLLFLSLAISGFCYWEAYYPVKITETSKFFKLELITKDFDDFMEKAKQNDFSFNLGNRDIYLKEEGERCVFSGKGIDGRKWEFAYDETKNSGLILLYGGDLDNNGQKDLIIFRESNGCGIAASFTYITMLMFDNSGMPAPFTCNSFSNAANDFIDDFQKDGNNKAIFYNMWFNDGYWVTTAYRVDNAAWERIDGKIGGLTFPCYTRFLNKGSKKPTQLAKGKKLFPPDFSNKTPVLSGIVQSVTKTTKDYNDVIAFELKDKEGKVRVCGPDYWFSTCCLVIDGKDNRKIVSYFAGDEAVLSAYKEMQDRKYEVDVYGRRSPDKYEPEIVWAKEIK